MADQRNDLPPVSSPNFLEKVREALSTYLGNRGNKLDRGLTVRDLADAGIIQVSDRYVSSSGRVNPVGGAGQVVIDAGYTVDLTPPPTPTGFVVSAAFENILITVDAQTYTQGNGHGRTKLYGSTIPGATFGTSELLMEFQGTVASYPATMGATYHLWATNVTKDGVESTAPAPSNDVYGLSVTTGQNVPALLDALTGQITSSELHTSLGTRIDLIDALDTVTGSVAYRVAQEASARGAALAAEVIDRNAAIVIEAADRAAAVLAEATARGAAITNESDVRQGADNALATSISLLTAGVAGGFDVGQSWYFDSTTEGWTSSGATQSWNAGYVDLVSTGADPQFISPVINVSGAAYAVIKARVKRLAGSGWDGTAYYSTAGHTFSATYKKTLSAPSSFAIGETLILEWDMTTLTAGGTDWVNSTITQIRLDIGTTSADQFSVDWVAVGRNAPGASQAGLLNEQTARISADSAEVTARQVLATKVTGLADPSALTLATLSTGLLFDEKNARSTADSSEVTARQTLATKVTGVADPSALTLATISSGLLYDEKTARSSADSSEVTARQTLSTSLIGATDPAGKTLANISSGLLYDERTARSTADSTEVTARQLLSSTMLGVTDPTGKTLGNVTSGIIYDERTTRATAVSGLATRTDTLEASVNSGTTGLATKASVTQVATAKAEAIAASATVTDTISARLNSGGDIAASIQTVATATAGKGATFVQGTLPTATKVGDLWIDTGSTNLISYSEDFGGTWSHELTSTVVADAATAPDGTLTADKLVETTTTGGHYRYKNQAQEAGVYTVSCHIKQAERQWAYVQMQTGGSKRYTVVIDLATGLFIATSSVNSPVGASYSITNAGNGWWRLALTSTHTTGNVMIVVGPCNSATPTFPTYALPQYTGDITKGIYVWGAQVELSSSVGTYIPTTATAGVSTVGGNKLYSWNGSAWAASDDSRVGQSYAQYTVKLDVNGKVSGYGLASSSTASAFEVRADKFIIAAPTGSAAGYVPFSVLAVPTVIGGITLPAGVYAHNAYIQDGQITNAKIANLAVDNAKIANLSAAKLTAGAIAVGQTISSTGEYSVGVPNWSIDGAGLATFNNAVVRGAVYATSGYLQGVEVRNAGGQVLLSSGNTADDILNSAIVVGGRNYRAEVLPTVNNGDTAVVASTLNIYAGTKSYRMTEVTVGALHYLRLSQGMSFKVGVQYTASYYVYNPSGYVTSISYVDSGYNATGVATSSVVLQGGYTRYAIQFTPTRTAVPTHGVLVYGSMPAGSYLYISGVQIEIGNKATDWTPAPEDVDAGIATAATTANWNAVADTGGKPADYADVTANNTAAGIAGQGAFATLSQITSGNVSTYIASAAIGNAQIGGNIYSTDWNGSTTGWLLDRAGNFYANSGTFRGSITGATGTFSGALSAATGTLGALTIASNGNIKSGQTAFNTGTGFYLGDDAGTPKFSIGNSAGTRMYWNGTDLYINTPTFEPFTASIPSGNLTLSLGPGLAAYGNRTVSVSGGKAPYAYAWVLQEISASSAGYITATGVSTNTLYTQGTADGTTNSAECICLVRDANGRISTASFVLSAQHAASGA